MRVGSVPLTMLPYRERLPPPLAIPLCAWSQMDGMPEFDVTTCHSLPADTHLWEASGRGFHTCPDYGHRHVRPGGRPGLVSTCCRPWRGNSAVLDIFVHVLHFDLLTCLMDVSPKAPLPGVLVQSQHLQHLQYALTQSMQSVTGCGERF